MINRLDEKLKDLDDMIENSERAWTRRGEQLVKKRKLLDRQVEAFRKFSVYAESFPQLKK